MQRQNRLDYVAISGSWRSTSSIIRDDVTFAVQDCITRGRGIVTGGALGVDFFATQYMLQHGQVPSSLVIIIPARLDAYIEHYRKRALQGVIRRRSANALEAQLCAVAHSEIGRLVELPGDVVSQRTYFARNSQVLALASELFAFQLDDSPGTADTVEKALEAQLPTVVRRYKSIPGGYVVRST